MGLDELFSEVKRLRDEGRIPTSPTREERVSWVYGNCVLSNPLVTREMVEAAVDAAEGRRARRVEITVHEDGVRYQVFRGGAEVADAVAPTAAEALRIAGVR